MLLQEWSNQNQPAESLLYKEGYYEQINFVSNAIAQLLFKDYEQAMQNIEVISTHTSKSVRLPVFKIKTEKATFVLRNNFYDWKISVDVQEEIKLDFKGLFNQTEEHFGCYCEGFPEKYLFKSYALNQKQFTISLPSNYHVFTFFWTLKNYLS